jgi:hypothetical protein
MKHNPNNCICCDDNCCHQFVFLHKTRRQKHYMCNDCIVPYLKPKIKQIIDNLKFSIPYELSIKCPGTYHGLLRNQCNKKININDINTCPGTSLYKDLESIKFILNNPGYTMCIGENCNNIIKIHNFTNEVTCYNCKKNWCKCCKKSPYHTNMNCFEYNSILENTENNLLMKELNQKGILKLCPQCYIPTTKEKDINGNYIGCNKIICVVCGVKWCWLCGESNIDYNHYNKNNNCTNKLWLGTKFY